MNILSYIFTELIYRPLFNALVIFYNAIPGHDIGMAIIVLTVLVRLLLYKMNSKSIKSQRELQEIQPVIKEIQQKYKDNKEKQAQELMSVYQKHKINPFSGCLPLLVQFPIIIGLYYVFLNGFQDGSLNILYSFVSNPGHLNTLSFRGIIDLAKPNVYMALLASVLQYFQTSSLMKVSGNNKKTNDGKAEEEKTPEEKAQDFAQALSQNMMYTMPVVTFLFALHLPSGLALYWSVTTLFAIVQQYLIIKKRSNEMPAQ